MGLHVGFKLSMLKFRVEGLGFREIRGRDVNKGEGRQILRRFSLPHPKPQNEDPVTIIELFVGLILGVAVATAPDSSSALLRNPDFQFHFPCSCLSYWG